MNKLSNEFQMTEGKRRAQSIQKRLLQRRHNNEPISDKWDKIAYSANNSILNDSPDQMVTKRRFNKPEMRKSDTCLQDFEALTKSEIRQKQIIRPFSLIPNQSMNPHKFVALDSDDKQLMDLSLPNIYVPSSEECSIFDTNRDSNRVTMYDIEEMSKNESRFLTKLEQSLSSNLNKVTPFNGPPHSSKDVAMTTAYFGKTNEN